MSHDDCIFCKIANGEFNTEFLLEDESVLAFRDISPKAKQHVLIIPRQHISTLNDFEQDHQALLGHMMLSAQRLAKQLEIDDSGYRVVMNCNREGGQEVYHVHFHLLGGEPLTWFK